MWNNFGGNSSNSGKIFILQTKIIRIMAGTQPRTSCRSLFKQLDILPVPCQHILLLTDSIINNQENLKQIHLYTILIQGMNKIFKDQSPTCLIFKKVHFMLVSKFSTVYHSVTILKNHTAKFKAALRKVLNTHYFYSVDKCFMCKDDLQCCFVIYL
jgi:hypothetical protein